MVLEIADCPFSFPGLLPHDYKEIVTGVVRQHGLLAYDINPIPGGLTVTLTNMDRETRHFTRVHDAENFMAATRTLREALPQALSMSRIESRTPTVTVHGRHNILAIGTHIQQQVGVSAPELAGAFSTLAEDIKAASVPEEDRRDAEAALNAAARSASPQRALVWLDVLTKITTLASAVPQWRERLAALIAALGGA